MSSRRWTDRIVSQSGETDNGDPFVMENLGFVLDPDRRTGVGDYYGAVFHSGGKDGAELFCIVGFQEDGLSQTLHVPFKQPGAVQGDAYCHKVDISGPEHTVHCFFQHIIVQQGHGICNTFPVESRDLIGYCSLRILRRKGAVGVHILKMFF